MKRISRSLILSGFFIMLMICFSANFAASETAYDVEDDTPPQEQAQQGVVSLDFKDADLKDVLKVFSQQSGLNFVAAKSVEDKKITLYMSNVMVEDALRTLLEANNLGLQQSPNSNILIVKENPTPPVETITRIYRLKYYSGMGSNMGESAFSGKGGEQQNKGVLLDAVIKPLLSQYGSMVNYINLLIITDVPDRFKLIDEIISELDKPIPEVMIEVELIETTADFLENLGVQWNQKFAQFTGGSYTTAFPLGSFKNGREIDTTGPEFNYGLIDASVMGWLLDMLQTDTNTKFLSKPRILCQDKEWAEIKVTENKIVSVKTTINGTGADAQTQTEVERMEVGTILRIIPSINKEEGFVSMLIEPEISRPTNSAFKDTDGTNFIDPQKRSMRTVVMVRDGETVAVGGFITTDDETTKSKVPWIGDIPIIGALFRHNTTDRVDKELLIFITPKIVNPVNRVNLWMQDSIKKKEQSKTPEDSGLVQSSEEVSPQQESAQAGETSDQTSASGSDTSVQGAKVEINDLSFREQEGMGDVKVQPASPNVMNVAK